MTIYELRNQLNALVRITEASIAAGKTIEDIQPVIGEQLRDLHFNLASVAKA